MTPNKCLKTIKLIKIDALWACRNIGGYGQRKIDLWYAEFFFGVALPSVSRGWCIEDLRVLCSYRRYLLLFFQTHSMQSLTGWLQNNCG